MKASLLEDAENIQKARESGRWWDIRWWTDEVYRTEFGLSAGEVDTAFAALKEIFSDKWARRQALSWHPMHQELFGARGLSPFNFLYHLGRDAEVLRKACLWGDSGKRLRDAAEFSGARAEVHALARWIEAGVDVQRAVPSGIGKKNCDWKASAGAVAIYGEVKCIDLAPVNKRPLDVPPWEREPLPLDLSAEGDKAMDVVVACADQLPRSGPGLFMISGNGSAAAVPFSHAAGKRIMERFAAAGDSLRHVAGVLVVKTFLFPDRGLVEFDIFVKNPNGLGLDLELLRRGFPGLICFDPEAKIEPEGASNIDVASVPEARA